MSTDFLGPIKARVAEEQRHPTDYGQAVLVRWVPGLIREVERLQCRFTAPIVCLCGSTRFKQTWITEAARLTLEGNIVLSVALWGHHERQNPSPEVKAQLDDLHKRKLDLCDWVWVLDVGGYIGDSTRSEIAYAKEHDKPVFYLSQQFPYYQEPLDPMAERIATLARALRDTADLLAIEYGGDSPAVESARAVLETKGGA